MKTKTLIGLLILAGIAPASGLAQPVGSAQPPGGQLLDWSIGYRVAYEDNIFRAPADEIDDIVSAPFLQLALNRAGTVLDATINGFVEHVTYLDDSFDADVRASLASNFEWRISDQRFHWVLRDTMSESSIDPLSFRNPDNQQFTNSLSTGPDLILRPGGANRLTIGARYTDFYAAESDDDSDGWLVSAAWTRRAGPGHAYGLQVKTATREFRPDSLNIDYDRHDAIFEYTHQRSLSGARDDFNVNLGYSVVEFDEPGRDDRDTPAVRLSWQRIQENGRRIGLTLVREIGDIASDLRGVVEADRPDVIFPTAVTGDPFTRSGIQLEWASRWQRLSLQASGFYDDLNYDSQDLDQNFFGVRVGLGYQLRPLVQFDASVDWSDREFTTVAQDDETVDVIARLTYQRTRHWSYALTAFWNDRSSSKQTFDADNAGVGVQAAYRR